MREEIGYIDEKLERYRKVKETKFEKCTRFLIRTNFRLFYTNTTVQPLHLSRNTCLMGWIYSYRSDWNYQLLCFATILQRKEESQECFTNANSYQPKSC